MTTDTTYCPRMDVAKKAFTALSILSEDLSSNKSQAKTPFLPFTDLYYYAKALIEPWDTPKEHYEKVATVIKSSWNLRLKCKTLQRDFLKAKTHLYGERIAASSSKEYRVINGSGFNIELFEIDETEDLVELVLKNPEPHHFDQGVTMFIMTKDISGLKPTIDDPGCLKITFGPLNKVNTTSVFINKYQSAHSLLMSYNCELFIF